MKKLPQNNDAKYLIWIAVAATSLVSLGSFFYSEAKAWNLDQHEAIEEKAEIRFEALDEKVDYMYTDVKEIKSDVKSLLKESKNKPE
jgi:hypothetical protein